MTLEEAHLQIAKDLFVHDVTVNGCSAREAVGAACLDADSFFMNYRCVGARAVKKDSAIETSDWCAGICHHLTMKLERLGELDSYDGKELERVSLMLRGSES